MSELFPKILKKLFSRDGSIKYLWQFKDGARAESIYFTFQDKEYACISSQIGCNVGCPFCASGSLTFVRNLTADEIADQIGMMFIDLKKTPVEFLSWHLVAVGNNFTRF